MTSDIAAVVLVHGVNRTRNPTDMAAALLHGKGYESGFVTALLLLTAALGPKRDLVPSESPR